MIRRAIGCSTVLHKPSLSMFAVQSRHWTGQTKGQLSTNDYSSTNSGMNVNRSAAQRISELGGITTTNEGMLIHKSRILGRASSFQSDVMSSRTLGATSLAYQVKQIETVLFYQMRYDDLDPRRNGFSGFGKMDFAQRSAYQRKNTKPVYNDFLQKLFNERTPNATLTASEVQLLRNQQRLVRSEMHARVHLICEHCFVRGHDPRGDFGGNGTLAQVASLLNIFRLTRLSFTLDGEIVFTEEGAMIWRSIKERDLEDKRKDRNLFTDSSRHGLISGARHYTNSNDGAEAVAKEASGDVVAERIASSSSSSRKEMPSPSATAVFNPAIQRNHLSADMQSLMEITINAIEMELRDIEGQISNLTDENSDAQRRRSSRLAANTSEHLLVICDSLYMCGRGTEAVDKLLTAVEEHIKQQSSGHEQQAVPVATDHPLLVRRIAEFRSAHIA